MDFFRSTSVCVRVVKKWLVSEIFLLRGERDTRGG